jgi:hypothetical protein
MIRGTPRLRCIGMTAAALGGSDIGGGWRPGGCTSAVLVATRDSTDGEDRSAGQRPDARSPPHASSHRLDRIA